MIVTPVKTFLQRYYHVLYYAFVISLPLKPSINNGVVITAVAIWILAFHKKQIILQLTKSPIYLAITTNFIVLALSLIYTSDMDAGISAVTRKIPLLIVPIIMMEVKVSERHNIVRLYIITWLLACLFSVVSTVIVYGSFFEDFAYYCWRLPDTLGVSANYYALFVGMAFLLIINDTSKKEIFPSIWHHVVTGICFILFLALLASRNVFFSIIVITAIKISYDLRKNVSPWLALSIVVIGVVSIWTIFQLFPYLSERTTSVYTLGLKNEPRYLEIKSGIETFLEEPILGVGIGDTDDYLQKYYHRYNFLEGIEKKYNVHNEYVYNAMSAGIAGLLSFLALTIFSVIFAWRSGDFLPRAFCAFFFIACFTEVVLFRNKGIAFFSFFVTFCLINYHHEKDSSR